MKRAAFTVAILSITVNLAQAQSLKETTDWLHDFMQANGSLFSVDANWHDRYQVTANGCEVTIQHDTEDLSCTKPKNKGACHGGPLVETHHFRQLFNLKDIDHARITVDSNPSFRGDSVNLVTLNERPLVTNSMTFVDGGKFRKQSWVDDDSRRAYVVLPHPEAAKRVAKAFQHAVALCGGKASPF
jgi:hypothetical protein